MEHIVVENSALVLDFAVLDELKSHPFSVHFSN